MKITRILIVAFTALIVFWIQPLNIGATEVVVPSGGSAREIAINLKENQIVRNVDEFLFILKLSGKEKKLQSGNYTLYKYKNPLYVINELSYGRASDIQITIPEGLTINETIEILNANGIGNKKVISALCRDAKFIAALGINATTLEGFLFPDTYAFNALQSDSVILMTMTNNFKKHRDRLGIKEDSLFFVLTLASLVEKEAKLVEERPVIARVFLNRLKANKPLESCATVLYAMKMRNYEKYRQKQRLTEKDLKFDSPYNTYLNIGLPPGPICSPGASSIKAALVPSNENYMYFVARGDGGHHFSITYKEHLAAKEKYRVKK
ncbi:hypothetical protein A2Y85_07045 [candidate division WOR-3 bacterium RBG_13_43_14]|uniref:Endolytic murein transglycosylase n=1 Tax=candidate division WOR-3 bacterium RBG_13_43_14 TaxID=1802590 RepID=A0A1F4U830_UNCW3|nr:MAG: hypothetical protein A2Y85_07045 [candidate division WOR-3 bacterium RBG_13_43_14]